MKPQPSAGLDAQALNVVRHSQRTVSFVLHQAAQRWPDRAAMLFEEKATTYAELEESSKRTLGGLHAAGLRPSDSMLIMLSNTPEFVHSWLAAAIGGIIEVPVNTDYRGEMLRHLIQHSRAETMLLEAEYLPRVAEVLNGNHSLHRLILVGGESAQSDLELGALEVLRFDQLISEAAARGPAEVHEHDPIGVMYTSGTTGPAKGGLISQRHAYEYANTCVRMLELSGDDTYLAPLPLFHIAGQWAMTYATLQAGATFVLKQRFSVNDFWQDCREAGVTVTFLLGAMAQFLYSQEPEPADSENPLQRVLMVPLIEGLDDFRERFQCQVTTCYGSTETGVPLIADFEVEDPTVAGWPASGYQLRLVDEHDEEVPRGTVGHLVARTDEPFVTMLGYHADPKATSEAFANLWLHSGDALRLDENGTYHFVDRLDDALRRRGENISSFEVEREVYAHHGVAECAVVGVPSAYTEDDLIVFAVLKPGESLTEQELSDFLDGRMPRFMVPDRVVIRDELPITPTGKIRKDALRQIAADDPAAGYMVKSGRG